MSSEWNTTGPKALLEALRPGGWCYGWTPNLVNLLVRLHKTEIIDDLRKMPPDHLLQWKVQGDPDATGQYATDRRTVVIRLG